MQFVFDRTDPNGGWGIDDMERINATLVELSARLQEKGIASLLPNLDFVEGEFPTLEKMNTIRDRVAEARSKFQQMVSTPETPETLRLITVKAANDLERILFDVDDGLRRMLKLQWAGITVAGGYTGL